MNSKKNYISRYPLKLRVLSVILAMTMMFSSSGFQVLANEAMTEFSTEVVQEQETEVVEDTTAKKKSQEDGGKVEEETKPITYRVSFDGNAAAHSYKEHYRCSQRRSDRDRSSRVLRITVRR